MSSFWGWSKEIHDEPRQTTHNVCACIYDIYDHIQYTRIHVNVYIWILYIVIFTSDMQVCKSASQLISPMASRCCKKLHTPFLYMPVTILPLDCADKSMSALQYEEILLAQTCQNHELWRSDLPGPHILSQSAISRQAAIGVARRPAWR